MGLSVTPHHVKFLPSDIAGALSSTTTVPVYFRLDNSYPSGGYPVTAKMVDLPTRILGFAPTRETYTVFPVYDVTHATFRVFTLKADRWIEVPTGTDLSQVEIYMGVFGF